MLAESKLKEYQHLIVSHILSHPKCAVWAAMGLGKTVSTLTAVERLQFCGHETKPTLVIAPLRVAKNVWPNEVREWEHLAHLKVVPIIGSAAERKDALYEKADVFTVNFENLEWLIQTWGDHWPYGMIVVDECFIAGTSVLTPDGEVPIETLRPGDEVCNATGIGRVRNTFKRQRTEIVCVEFVGKQTWCSPNHLFFTSRGWIAAAHLSEGDELYEPDDCVRVLQHPLSNETSSTEILREVLLSEVEDEAAGVPCQSVYTRNEKQNIRKAEPVFRHAVRTERSKARCYSEYQFRKTVVGGDTRPGIEISSSDRSQTCETGWQRGGFDGSTEIALGAFRERVGAGISNTDESEERGISDLLSRRSRQSYRKDSCGNRRIFTSSDCSTATRSKERRLFDKVRVERVTVHEQGSAEFRRRSGEKDYITFYDVEVSGHPSFFANRVLVHNCTKLKSLRANIRQNSEGKRWVQGQGGVRAKSLLQTTFKFDTSRIVELTGTPSPNGLQDLWGQIFFLDYGKRLGRTIEGFKTRWFQRKWDGFGLEALPHAQAEIEAALKDIVISLRTEDWFDLQKPIEREIWVELPEKAKLQYRELERKFYTEIQGHPIEAFNAGAKTAKLRQLAAGAAYLGTADDPGERQFTEAHAAKLDALEEIEEEAGGMPLLVAYHFKSDLIRIQKRFPHAKVLDTKASTITDWNAGKIPMLLAHPASAGHGLNLQRGSNILVYFNIDWNLEQQLQILERIGPVRQAQAGLNRNVFVYRILARNTVDEDLLDNNRSKGHIQDALMKGLTRRLQL